MSKLCFIPLRAIQPKPLFDLSFWCDNQSLLESLKTFGVIQPILLVGTENECEVLDGGRRINIARVLKWPTINAVLYSRDEIDRAKSFLLAIEANCWGREFNLIEKGLILKQAKEILSIDELKEKVYPLLKIKNDYQADGFLKLLNLPQVIKEEAVLRQLPQGVCEKYLKFLSVEAKMIFKLLSPLPINQNKLSELLDWLHDLSRLEGVDGAILLESLLAGVDGEGSYDRVEILRKNLRERRYPRYQKKQREFNKTLSEINLPKNVQVTPSVNFEEKNVEVRIQLGSEEESERVVELFKQKGWGKLFEVL